MEKETKIVIGIYIGLIILVGAVGFGFSKLVSDYEVIEPEPGIRCVVVSRMFNTSVDCWKVEK